MADLTDDEASRPTMVPPVKLSDRWKLPESNAPIEKWQEWVNRFDEYDRLREERLRKSLDQLSSQVAELGRKIDKLVGAEPIDMPISEQLKKVVTQINEARADGLAQVRKDMQRDFRLLNQAMLRLTEKQSGDLS